MPFTGRTGGAVPADGSCVLANAVFLTCLPCSGSVLRGDAELYKIYAYLVLLRLSELGVEQFRCWFVNF